ncbi:hypothetical protein K435DRAFT_871408 [Dendrothele bispora CBS 962.96]|uniref:Uncharacterized protein n=1 Tax=Dendrothele bispora (strain CBS 962.96) TaxID=1314807 RepID=A0A4S8L479_DENBC|nr:hypothetical protein K435DRAFT_871408 [Dendrothele bispora CBS 962.96]
MRFTFSVFSLAACATLFMATHAVPVGEDQALSSRNLYPRGQSQSAIKAELEKDTKCPSQEEITNIGKSLNGDKALTNGLFWTNDVNLNDLDKVKKAHSKKVLRDIFPTEIRDLILERCNGAAHTATDGWMLMSTAMATIASGEAWILTPKANLVPKNTLSSHADKYFKQELAIIEQKRMVQTLKAFYYEGGKLLPENGVDV